MSLLVAVSLQALPVAAESSFHAFPEKFRWCVATAAHQIEGQNVNSDWWAFEQEPGRIKNGDKSGRATDHWNRVAEDSALISKLGVSLYRFSVEWAKIEPRPGVWDESAIAHYRSEIAQLRKLGIEPMITLHHFTFPLWVRSRGGWEWAGVADAFERYTRKVFTDLGKDVRLWVTINEPMPHLGGGYITGEVPPARKGAISGIESPMRGLLKSHARAYHALHELARATHQEVEVGFAHHLRTMDAAFALSPLDHLAASVMHEAWNWLAPDAAQTGRYQVHALWLLNHDEMIEGLAGTQDFFGLNYYTGDLIAMSPFTGFSRSNRSWTERNDMGWDIYPDGFYRLVKQVMERFPKMPIYITENGIADAKDEKRTEYIRSHLAALLRAMNEGAPVKSYCYWSLLDNFEWNEGLGPRFGLYEVNYQTFERKERASARAYREIIRNNGF